ncbi:MAG: hypothetical protein KGI69_01495 [Patescibacteria group bacterium]|nr:hypothetical protein [Patescibacteria group bacterium]
MTCRRHSSIEHALPSPGTAARGSVLADVLVAFAVAALSVASLSQATASARQAFGRAESRSSLIQAFEEHQGGFEGLMPGERRTAVYEGVRFEAEARRYAQSRIETDIAVSYDASRAASRPYSDEAVAFAMVRPDPSGAAGILVGGRLCAADMDADEPVGSYGFFASSSKAVRAHIVPVTLPIDPLLPLTDIAVHDGRAYVAADSAKRSDPDFIVADISDPSRPRIVGAIDTGPGIASIAVAGGHAFAASASAAAQLQSIRLSEAGPPVLEASYRLPLPEASTSPPHGTAIAYSRGIAYLGTDRWDGEELSAIDVSDPAAPAKVGGFETGGKINDIEALERAAYVAAADASQFRALDVSDPRSISLISAFSPSGWERQSGERVHSFEGRVSFGRTSGGFDIAADKELFVSAGEAFAGAASANMPGGVYGIASDRRRTIVATASFDKELTIYDAALSPASTREWPLPAAPQAMTCDRSTVYVLARTAPVIYEVTLSTSGNDAD